MSDDIIGKMQRIIASDHCIADQMCGDCPCNETANRILSEIMSPAIEALRAENEKLRNEVMSDYHEGWEEGVKAERERCAKIAEQARNDTCDGPVAWSMADSIADAIRESE